MHCDVALLFSFLTIHCDLLEVIFLFSSIKCHNQQISDLIENSTE